MISPWRMPVSSLNHMRTPVALSVMVVAARSMASISGTLNAVRCSISESLESLLWGMGTP